MSAVSLNLVVIHSADPQRSRTFYEALGLRFRRERHGSGPEHFACELGDTVFEIYPCRNALNASRAIRIGLRVPVLDAALAALTRVDAKVVSGPKETAWGRRAVVVAPDGYRLELSE